MSEEEKNTWEVLESETFFETKIMKFRADRCRLPDGRIMPKYYVMDFPDWVHVVAQDKEGHLIMVDQYRHAAKGRFFEVPGGSMDPGNLESAEEAARRELLEETGYEPGSMKFLGAHCPNPALQSNRMHTFLAKECWYKQELDLDPYEDLSVRLVPVDEVFRLVRKGELSHSLMIASLMLAEPFLEK